MSFRYDIQSLRIIALRKNGLACVEEHDLDGVRKSVFLFVGQTGK
jgi:hypothetical protein